jgi:hypothetical protein
VPSEQEVPKLDTSQKPVFNLSYVGAKFYPPGVYIVGKNKPSHVCFNSVNVKIGPVVFVSIL